MTDRINGCVELLEYLNAKWDQSFKAVAADQNYHPNSTKFAFNNMPTFDIYFWPCFSQNSFIMFQCRSTTVSSRSRLIFLRRHMKKKRENSVGVWIWNIWKRVKFMPYILHYATFSPVYILDTVMMMIIIIAFTRIASFTPHMWHIIKIFLFEILTVLKWGLFHSVVKN